MFGTNTCSKRPSLGIIGLNIVQFTVTYNKQSLVMPTNDTRNGFFYPHLTLYYAD